MALCVWQFPAMKVNQQLFQTTADGKLKEGISRRKEPQTQVIVSREGYEMERGILMTLARAHETHRLPEHIHSWDIWGVGKMCS